MKTSGLINPTLLFAAIFCACIPGSAQRVKRQPQKAILSFDRSKELSAEALKSSQAGDSRRAIDIASAGLQDCPTGTVGSACRGLLNYTMGYVYQQQAQSTATPADRERALTAAAASYRATLRDDPNNGTVHFNLALLLSSSGDQTSAIAELQEAIKADPTQWQYSVKLGDIQAQQKNWKAAMQAYE